MAKTLLTPRQLKTQATKNKILSVAGELMKKYGYDALTVKNICDRAKISNGTFFHYFKTKDDMMTYYLVKGREDYLESGVDAERTGDVKQAIIDIYKAYVSYCEKTGLAFVSKYYSTSNQALNNHNPAASDGDSVISYDDVLTEVRAAMTDGMLDDSCTAERISDEICIIIKGIIFDWCLSNGRSDMKSTVERLLGIYFDGVTTSKYHQKYGRRRS